MEEKCWASAALVAVKMDGEDDDDDDNEDDGNDEADRKCARSSLEDTVDGAEEDVMTPRKIRPRTALNRVQNVGQRRRKEWRRRIRGAAAALGAAADWDAASLGVDVG